MLRSGGKQKGNSDAARAGRKLRPQEGISRTLCSAAYANQELTLTWQDGRALGWRAEERAWQGEGSGAGSGIGKGSAEGWRKGAISPAFAGVGVAPWLSRDAGLLWLCWVELSTQPELSSPSASGKRARAQCHLHLRRRIPPSSTALP